MKLQHVTIAKRTFALAFTLDALAEMQDSIDKFSLKDVAQYARSARNLPAVLHALAQQGELLEGRELEPEIDRAWFGSHISPSIKSALKVQTAVLDAMAAGLRMETETGEEEEVDVTLEEIRKKKNPQD